MPKPKPQNQPQPAKTARMPTDFDDITRRITDACRLIDTSPETIDLTTLAQSVGLGPYVFHRAFKSRTGITPRHYVQAARARRVRDALRNSDTITDAIVDAGYNAASRFYAEAGDVLGMSPSAWRRGGAGVEIRFAIGECSYGAILVAQSPRGICAIFLGDDPEALARELQDNFPNAQFIGDDTAFADITAQVIAFVENPSLGLDLPLDIRGTAFQQRVWLALRAIPVGTTVSYAELAKKVGDAKATRAVAGACAANTIAVAIPCHRVVRTDGSISGYRWGVERKRALLDAESHPPRV